MVGRAGCYSRALWKSIYNSQFLDCRLTLAAASVIDSVLLLNPTARFWVGTPVKTVASQRSQPNVVECSILERLDFRQGIPVLYCQKEKVTKQWNKRKYGSFHTVKVEKKNIYIFIKKRCFKSLVLYILWFVPFVLFLSFLFFFFFSCFFLFLVDWPIFAVSFAMIHRLHRLSRNLMLNIGSNGHRYFRAHGKSSYSWLHTSTSRNNTAQTRCDCVDISKLDIDRDSPLKGTTAAYNTQVLISTGKSDWNSKIELENGLAAELKGVLGKAGLKKGFEDLRHVSGCLELLPCYNSSDNLHSPTMLSWLPIHHIQHLPYHMNAPRTALRIFFHKTYTYLQSHFRHCPPQHPMRRFSSSVPTSFLHPRLQVHWCKLLGCRTGLAKYMKPMF